uniref:Putative tail protein n=1 Tax=viral metagenome TaxID=1070528 RepID=A0A6M3L8P3_9ZZZZ
MSDTRANRRSGGPKAYLAAFGTSLPSLAASSITWSNNEIQTITPAGTWTSGTYTLEVTYADGSSETTAVIALDADAATIKAALAALDGLTAADLTVTGGPLNATGPIVPVVITFGGAYANTNMALVQIDVTLIVGGGTATVAETAQGRLWAELPDVVGGAKVKPLHKTEDHRPAWSECKTDSNTVEIGFDELALIIKETDLDAFNLGLSAALNVLTPAGAGQVSLQTLTQPSIADADASLYAIALVYQGPMGDEGWGQVHHYFRCKRLMTGDFTAEAGKVRTLGLTWEVMGDATNNSGKCRKLFEYISAATS